MDRQHSLWGHVAEWSAVAVAAVYLLAAACRAAHAPGWLPVLVTLTAAVIAISSARAAMAGSLVTMWLLGWGLLGTGWSAWMHWASPWGLIQVCILLVPAAVLVPVGVLTIGSDQAEVARQDELGGSQDDDRQARYTAMLEGIGIKGVKAEEYTETGSGEIVDMVLPRQGKATVDTVASARPHIERALRVRPDAVRVEPDPDDSSRFRLHIVRRNFLAADLPYPDFSDWLTISKPLPVGLREDGKTASVLFQRDAVMITGVRGAGKTNLLEVLIALFSQCVDTVIFVIDIEKGGRLAAPWIEPWVRGDCGRPVIDWVATTRDEAQIMLTCVQNWLTLRATSGVGGSKITPSAALPQVIILCDEVAGLIGQDFTRYDNGWSNNRFSKAATDITRLGRSEAIGEVWVTQRATNSFIGSGDLKSQCKIRFTLGVATEAEARSSVPDDSAAARQAARLAEPGSMLITAPGIRKPMPVKAYRLDPASDADMSRIHQIARRNGDIRPQPEAAAVSMMGDDYARRWERSGLYAKLAAAGAVPVAGKTAEPATAHGGPPDPGGRSDHLRVTDPSAEFASIIGSAEAGLGELQELDKRGPHPAKLRIFALLADRPSIGWSVLELETRLGREGLGVRRETIHGWLADEILRDRVERVADGPRGRYRLKNPGHK